MKIQSKPGYTSGHRYIVVTGNEVEVKEKYADLLESFKWYGSHPETEPTEVDGAWTATIGTYESCD